MRACRFLITALMAGGFPAAAGDNPVTLARMKSPVKSDENITLYTTAAWPSPAQPGSWEVEVHGVIFEKENRTLLSNAIISGMGIDPEELPDAARKLLRERMALFLADNERRKTLPIQAGSTIRTLPPSEPNGHFRETFTLSSTELQEAAGEGTIPLRALTPPGDGRTFTGSVCVIPDNSRPLVISDVDDTIKITAVNDKEEVKLNTFCRPFLPVDGMAAVYQRWASQSLAGFCYVTGSPWQLYEPLEAFRAAHIFPQGPWHMKYLRVADPETIRTFLNSSTNYKLRAISPLLTRWPSRPVFLIGDSGEQDPEVYGSLARQHPDRIAGIYIRKVTPGDRSAPRYLSAFSGIKDSIWHLFSEAAELPQTLP